MKKITWILMICFFIYSTVFAGTKSSPYPIKPGAIGPISPGNLQYPFLCQTNAAGLGDPVIDNHNERGVPIKDASGKIIGYSELCGSPMRIDYFYKPRDKDIYYPLPKDETGKYQYPADLDVTIYGNKYIIRIERGTINRFMYMIALLQDPVSDKTPQQSGYMNKAIFNFQGGTGVGYTQASNSASRIMNDPHRLIEDIDPITLGYAVLFSTGNATSTHYNLKLGLETAKMVKEQLVTEFGTLKYTLALGGSGGAVQQYVFAQLDPHLIDGMLMLASYPDFITQTIYASDCALLEYYFDNIAFDKPTPWAKRQLIEGFSASSMMPANDLGQLNPQTMKIRSSDGKLGSDTCINGWGGAVPNVMNPRYPTVDGIDIIKITKPIDWSSWGSESTRWQFGTYPTNLMDVTPNTIDNTGVQYGLVALRKGEIDKETFFELNKTVGGWKPVEQFAAEDGFPMSGPNKTYDGWSVKNATALDAYRQGKIAIRKEGDNQAISAAQDSGTVFEGNIDIPIIDLKSDQEDMGNMHSIIHSFVTRARLQQHGKAGNQVIWIARLKNHTESLQGLPMKGINAMTLQASRYFIFPTIDKKPGNLALTLMQQWVENIQRNPQKSVVQNKPSYLKDGCYYQDGILPSLKFGDTVWDGVIDPTEKKGVCAEHFNINPTPRMMSGGSILGQTFKCKLVSIEKFIEKEGYGKVIMSAADIQQLKEIYPLGVCDNIK